MAARLVKVIVFGGAVFFLVFGFWAFFDPRSFFQHIAHWPPYNRHLLHDAGAFQLGVGAALLAALASTDAVLVALGGGSVASIFHYASHLEDKDLGGRSSDPLFLGLFMGALVVATLLHLWKKHG